MKCFPVRSILEDRQRGRRSARHARMRRDCQHFVICFPLHKERIARVEWFTILALINDSDSESGVVLPWKGAFGFHLVRALYLALAPLLFDSCPMFGRDWRASARPNIGH